MQVWASVNEADIGQIQPGQDVRFTVDAFPNETFKGVVGQIRLNATMTQNVVTYPVIVATDNEDLRLKPYMTAKDKTFTWGQVGIGTFDDPSARRGQLDHLRGEAGLEACLFETKNEFGPDRVQRAAVVDAGDEPTRRTVTIPSAAIPSAISSLITALPHGVSMKIFRCIATCIARPAAKKT